MGPEQMWVCHTEGSTSTSSLDHFVAILAANLILGERISAIMLPGETFKTESMCMLQ